MGSGRGAVNKKIQKAFKNENAIMYKVLCMLAQNIIILQNYKNKISFILIIISHGNGTFSYFVLDRCEALLSAWGKLTHTGPRQNSMKHC